MTVADVIGIAINISMFLIVLGFGFNATFDNVTYLFRRPRLFVRAIVAMNIVMLGLVIGALMVFNLPPPIRIALVALALSPVPPIFPSNRVKAGGRVRYTLGLLAGAGVAAVVLAPLGIELLGRSFGVAMHMPVSRVASIIVMSVLLPLLVGIAIRYFAPTFAERAARPVSLFATILLIVAVLPVLVIATKTILALAGTGALACLILFSVVGVAVGHLLGGPEPGDRTILALATGSRHPGIAIALTNINFPEQKAVMAVVFYHLLIGSIVSIPYLSWRRRTRADAPDSAGTPGNPA